MRWLPTCVLGLGLLAAGAACEDDSAYKGGRPLETTGGPMDGGAGDAAVADAPAATTDGSDDAGPAD